ncbi:MAG: DUF2141 domain-containing protein [Cyclobacteriaceae bacterium]|nr:DUF2141 domain-containing protein [Cyclobacteriaceae bacterium HetDA_MAG_MS6]
MRRTLIIAVGILVALGITLIASGQSRVDIEVKEVGSDEGQVIIMLFDNADSFSNRTPVKRAVVPAKKGNVNHSFYDVQEGEYAVMVAHDKNKNNVIDKNFVGFPKEPVGASNMMRFGKPSFEKSKFKVGSSNIELEVRFMNN